MDTFEKVKFLVSRLGTTETARQSGMSVQRVSNLLKRDQSFDTQNTRFKVNALFKHEYRMYENEQKLILERNAKPKPAPVKNYDDENLEDLKCGARKGGAGGGSNNAWSFSVSESF